MLTLAVEGGALLLAFALGGLFGVPAPSFALPAVRDLVVGSLAVVPLLGVLSWVMHSRSRACARIRELLDGSVMPLFERSGLLELCFVSVLAGVGEEALFRGVIQGGAAFSVGVPAAIALASVLFGLAHAVTATYAILATSIGVYLGLLYVWTGELWSVILTHAVYDFVALVWLQREHRRRRSRA